MEKLFCAAYPAAPVIEDTTDPWSLWHAWFDHAASHELSDANAAALATVDAQQCPDVRIVLIKDVSPKGLTFFTNAHSTKGQQLLVHPVAALCVHWKSTGQQVRVRGQVIKVSDADADAYFASRARLSRLGACASEQSQPLESREVLWQKIVALDAQYAQQPIPRPAHWHGYCLQPLRIEFWQEGPHRLHDRMVFLRNDLTDEWQVQRLNP